VIGITARLCRPDRSLPLPTRSHYYSAVSRPARAAAGGGIGRRIKHIGKRMPTNAGAARRVSAAKNHRTALHGPNARAARRQRHDWGHALEVERMNAGHVMRAGIGALALLACGTALAADPVAWQLNMAPGVTETSAEVYRLHNLILGICVVIGILVFGAMGYAMFAFRKSKGAVAAQFSHNTVAEVIWTVVPILILVAMAWPATRTLFRMYDTTESEMTVKITGYQWMWRYEILNYRGEPTAVNFVSRLDRESDATRQLNSGKDPYAVMTGDKNTYLLNVDKPLRLPTDTKIRFVVTADDVIHAWWVPALGWKQDAIPGIVNEAWTKIGQPGTYRGQCTELCGKDHGFMPIVVEALPRAEFESWLAAQQPAAAAPVEAAPAETAPATPETPADAPASEPAASDAAATPTTRG
jgi:cytochrome c oxidase subunit 2